MDMLWHFFEISGTIAFALSGALVGISRKMDIFGVFVLSLCTAIGGGIFRDLLVGNIPPNSLRTGLYISITMGVTCILFIASGRQGWLFHSIHRFRTVYLIADKWDWRHLQSAERMSDLIWIRICFYSRFF